jgi:uncharacterized protein YcbX
MEISQLYIYPIKSLAGIAVSKTKVTDRGLEYDRRWVLVDEQNYHVTQREMPELGSYATEITAFGIKVINNKTQESILVPFQPLKEEIESIKVWEDVIDAQEVSENISVWFSESLGKKVRLMFQSNESKREVESKYQIKGGEILSTADGYPILLISEESLNDLNSKLKEPVEMLRFRPNIVIKGVEAFGEDKMEKVGIGEAEIIGVKNCGRCIMVNNPLDGKIATKEPLKTLSEYRKEGNNVLFGRNFLIAKQGEITTGIKLNLL